MKMARLETALCFLLLASCAAITVKPEYSAAKRDATKMFEALQSKHYELFAKYMLDKAIDLIGGTDALVAILKSQDDENLKSGLSIESVEFDNPTQMVQVGSELHIILPMVITMNVKGGTLVQKSHLYGISVDNGANWKFIDAMKLNGENIRQIIPNYNPELKIPSREKPIFLANPLG